MKLKYTLLMGLICVMSAGGAYLAAANRPSAPAKNPVSEVLQLTGDQTQSIQNADPQFEDESKKLATALEGERQKLMDLLQSKETGAQAINAQLERAIQADADLERRVVNHLLTMRQHLTQTQSQQLMNMCNQCMCGRNSTGMGNGMGMGMEMGMGRGPMSRMASGATPATLPSN